MANQVRARLSGDDYQHLYTWYTALELIMTEKRVEYIIIEDENAGHVDDVTVCYSLESDNPSCFYQIKYHVDHRNMYSANNLIENNGKGTSLLEKFWKTWKILNNQRPDQRIKLVLLSNWMWDHEDPIRNFISGHNNGIKEEFWQDKKIGAVREQWKEHLQASETEFREFVQCLRFRLGFDCTEELESRVLERMGNLGLNSDAVILNTVIGIVRSWIKRGEQKLEKESFERILKDYKLHRPVNAEYSMTVYLITIKKQKFDIEPDHIIDWQNLFEGDELKKGYQLLNPLDWNERLLPELQAFEAKINQETDCRFIRARGLSRLSAWFAFGSTFSEVARYTIEIAQATSLWRTDAEKNNNFRLIVTNKNASQYGEIIEGEGSTVAVGISITGSLDDDVREYLAECNEKIAALLLLQPEHGVGSNSLQNAGDVVALADVAKDYMQRFVKYRKATRLLLFYYGPISGACFIGHRLNAVCKEIQIMEGQNPGYAPSFLLKF